MLKKVLLLSVSLVMATAVHAQDGSTDPLLQAMNDSDLLTTIDETQTQEGVTVTLNWVYADTQNLKVNYTLENIDPIMLYPPYSSHATLRNAEGFMFSYANSRLEEGSTADSLTMTVDFYNQAVRPIDNSDQYEVVDNYFMNRYETLPQTLSLQLELRLGDFEVADWTPLDSIDTDYAIGDYVELIGPFTFDVTLPLQAAVELEPMQTVEQNGLAVTLEALSISPTRTSARLCYQLPDARDWLPQASITIDGVPGYLSGHGVVDMAQFENTERRCRNLRFDAFYDGNPGTLDLSLDVLETSMMEGPDDWARIAAALAEDGIDIDVIFEQSENGGGSIRIEEVDVPEGFNLQEAADAAREALGDRISGPWVFQVELP
ncbi:MAG: DUF4179 domain-containing protein [Anaerolineae bacterium]|nr:DUF4179 domain-containing protein [Anaerolineae bacterium]